MPRYKQIDGTFVQFTAEEEAARDIEEAAWTNEAPARALTELRYKRDNLLKETDIFALADLTMTDDMKTYRQALRDLPSGKDTVAKCTNATWPTKP